MRRTFLTWRLHRVHVVGGGYWNRALCGVRPNSLYLPESRNDLLSAPHIRSCSKCDRLAVNQ